MTIKIIFYSAQPLCLGTQADTHLDTGTVMAPSNTSPDSAEASEVNFTSSSTEFGTNNCATHHICLDIKLFVKSTYILINVVGVQGISGKAMA